MLGEERYIFSIMESHRESYYEVTDLAGEMQQSTVFQNSIPYRPWRGSINTTTI